MEPLGMPIAIIDPIRPKPQAWEAWTDVGIKN